jgi:hypothetical protein
LPESRGSAMMPLACGQSGQGQATAPTTNLKRKPL